MPVPNKKRTWAQAHIHTNKYLLNSCFPELQAG